MTLQIKTRSINVLISSTNTHTVGTLVDHGPPVGLQETCDKNVTWFMSILQPKPASQFEISNSSLIKRHGQARIQKYTTGAGNTSWGDDKYDFNSTPYTDSYGISKSGTVMFVYNNNYSTNYPQLVGLPQGACKMSAFSNEGQTNDYASQVTFGWGGSQWSYTEEGRTLMSKPASSTTDPLPISMGPSAGVSSCF